MPLRIIAISNRYLPVIGGAEHQLALLSSMLHKRGHQIQIATRHISSELPFEELIDDIPIHRLRPTGLGKLANALIIPSWIMYLINNRNNFDIIHCQSIGPAAIASIIAGKLLNKPVILRVATAGDIARKETGQSVSVYTKFIRKFIVSPQLWHNILSKASAIVALSQEIRDEAETFNLGHLVKVIPNSVDCNKYHPISKNERNVLRKQLGLPSDIPIIFTTGRLVARKRLDVLISALSKITKDYPQCKVLIAGSGEHQSDSVENELKQQVNGLNLQDNVHFLGLIDNVVDYLQVSDIFVFPSANEGMPNAVLEAMATEIPIIASRIGGTIDLVDDTCAYLHPVGDVEAFTQSILNVLYKQQEAQKRAKLAGQKVKNNFSAEAITLQYENLYRELLKL